MPGGAKSGLGCVLASGSVDGRCDIAIYRENSMILYVAIGIVSYLDNCISMHIAVLISTYAPIYIAV